MKSLAVLALATLLLALFFQGCPSSLSEAPTVQGPTAQAATPPSEAPPGETAAPPPPAEPTAAPPQLVSFEFSGQGEEATQLYPLDAGLIRCDYTYVGHDNFIAFLLDSQGNFVAGMANEIGTCEGSSADSIRSAGDYLLTVITEGDWTFRCEANAHGSQPSPRQPVAVFRLAGRGNEATDFIHLEGGLLRGDYTYAGVDNFIVGVLDSQGNPIALVANEIGSCEGSSAGAISEAGDYLLKITADGNWTITLSQ